MARNTSVTISDHFATFISDQVRSGRYGSASDVVRAGLRLLEEQDTQLRSLQEALIAGEQSGPPEPFDLDAMKACKRTERAPRT